MSKLSNYQKYNLSLGLIISSYLFGAIVIGHQLITHFEYLTPLHLLFTIVLLFINHRPTIDTQEMVWIFICFLLGFIVEVIGVQGQQLFGVYKYHDVLGPKYFDVPISIGLNWVLVTYAICSVVSQYIKLSTGLQILLAAALMVGLDFIIEPVAISLKFWTWSNGTPPIQNYIGWSFVSIIQASIWFGLMRYTSNRLSIWVLGFQLLFFLYLNWML